MASINIASGFLCLTSIPRDAGKKFLEYLHRWTSPSTSFDYQCLAATIAIMVGSDSGFRAIICRALDALRGISLENVTWEEFKAGIAQQQQPWPLRRNLSKFGQEASSSGSRAQELVDSSGSQGSASHGLPHVSQRELEEIDPDNLYQKYVRDKEQRADLIDTSFTEQSETVMRERQIRLQNLPSDDDL